MESTYGSQVLISQTLQCHTKGFSYEKPVVPLNDNIDLHLNDKHAVLLLVQGKAPKVTGKVKTFKKAAKQAQDMMFGGPNELQEKLNSRLADFKQYKSTNENESKWIVMVMEAKDENCDKLIKWMWSDIAVVKNSKKKRQCEEGSWLKRPYHIGDIDSPSPDFEHASVWVLMKKPYKRAPKTLLYVLICVESSIFSNSCSKRHRVSGQRADPTTGQRNIKRELYMELKKGRGHNTNKVIDLLTSLDFIGSTVEAFDFYEELLKYDVEHLGNASRQLAKDRRGSVDTMVNFNKADLERLAKEQKNLCSKNNPNFDGQLNCVKERMVDKLGRKFVDGVLGGPNSSIGVEARIKIYEKINSQN